MIWVACFESVLKILKNIGGDLSSAYGTKSARSEATSFDQYDRKCCALVF